MMVYDLIRSEKEDETTEDHLHWSIYLLKKQPTMPPERGGSS
jgi:hypothetical protein